MPSTELLEYIQTFLGFGQSRASLWFIGLEQGGGSDLPELRRRLRAWHRLDRAPLIDLEQYHALIAEPRWFGEHAKIQPTWGKLVRVTLARQGLVGVNRDQVRHYQAEQLGRAEGDTVIADLMPLPCPRVGQWPWTSLSHELRELRSRAAYLRAFRGKRVEALRAAVERFRPEVVVFLGESQDALRAWSEIAGFGFRATSQGRLEARSTRTRFVVVRHPTAHGVTNAYFEAVGRTLAA
jgi:hypothetical protein